MKKLATAVAAAFITMTAPAAMSQTIAPAVNVSAVQASCLISPASCSIAVNDVLASLRNAGATPAEINSAIAAISGAVISAAESSPAGISSYSGIVNTLATNSSDATQTAGLVNIASAMSTGSVEGTRSAVAQVASPN